MQKWRENIILNNTYIIQPTATFKEELEQIIYYIKYNLKEPSIAINFYKKVIREVSSLKFMPERYTIAYNDKINTIENF